MFVKLSVALTEVLKEMIRNALDREDKEFADILTKKYQEIKGEQVRANNNRN